MTAWHELAKLGWDPCLCVPKAGRLITLSLPPEANHVATGGSAHESQISGIAVLP